MNSYKKELLNDTNGSRYAGRIWTDKTVFAAGEDSTFDGGRWNNNILYFGNNGNENEWQVETSDDFLNVFSTVTSSQQIIQQHRAPLDIVLVLDMSGSMGDSVGGKSRIEKAADAINTTLEEISEMDGARVGLQIYSSIGSYNRTEYAGFQTVFPLDHYTKTGNNNYLTVTQNSSWFGTSGDYKVQFRAKKTSDNQTIDKTITSTGGTTTQMGIYEGMKMLAEAKDVKETVNGETLHRTPVMILITDGVPTYISNGNWWSPTITQENQQLGDGSKNAEGLNFATMLTAAYMKKVVNKHYYDDENGKNGRSARIYTISVDTDNENKDIMKSTFDPKDNWNSNSEMTNKLKAYWQSYQNNQQEFNVNVTTCTTAIFCTPKTYSIKHPTSNTDGISDLTEDDIKYNNAYYDVQSTNLQEIFGNIMDSLSGEIFNPVEGTNSAGVNNSLTFAEPLGLYMEIKDKAITVNNPVKDSENVKDGRGIYDIALLLYNEMHGIVKTAVYDESFIEKQENFQEGWYSSEGNYINQTDGKWENGDTYYVKKETALQFVPTIPEKSSSSSDDDDLKHIVYTLYRFAENKTDRNTTIANPCYGGNSEVTFKLSDIRIWVEESGNYVNQSGMTIPGSGYDSMLYINLPANAIPSEVAKITLDDEGNIAKYDTNINEKGITNPLRVFYSVGIKDEYLTEDGLDMDLTKVSQEYIQHFKNDDGSLNFYDSYWSGSTYDEYENQDKRTRGDTTLSFSPNQNNKYYFFQKNLTLYTNAYYIDTNGSITKVDSSKYETKPLAKIYEGQSDTNGIPKDVETQIQNDLTNNTISKDSIVILSKDVITNNNSFTNGSNYYIIDEYYAPADNGTGKKVEIVIQRSGQDLSLGIEGESDKKGEYLGWKDKSGKNTKIYDFNAKPSDGEYVLATKVGALRVGNLSSNIGTKQKNKTETSYNYYIPTISATKENDDVEITNYLGNNGRLIAQDSLLMITKELEGTLESKEDDEFNFEVYIEGKEGDFQGIIVKKHSTDTGVHWDYIIEKVEVVVDEEGYLLAPDDSKATITYTGHNVYMKLHNKTDFGDNLSIDATQENTDDIQKFYVMVDYYNTSSPNSSVLTNQKVYVWETATGNTENGNENELGDKFKTKSSYQTRSIKFGYKSETSKEIEYPDGWTDEDKKLTPYTAKITLKPDEGIIINGIKSGADYKVTEVITKNQDISGVNFKGIEHKMNNSTKKYTHESDNSEETPGGSTNGFKKDESDDKEDKTYMVFGDTGSNIEEVHYTNYDKLKHLTISKGLKPEEGTIVTDYDKTVEFPFKISFHTLDDKPLKADIQYKIIKINEEVTVGEFKELKLEGKEDETFSFNLKADEKIVFDKLPLETGYKYELNEEATEGYKSENSTIHGIVDVNSNGVMPQTVTNIKLIPKVHVTLDGTKNLIGDLLKPNQFDFTITPDDNNPNTDPIKDEKTVENDDKGNISFINDDYIDPGVYNYTIKETNNKEKGIIYDTKEYNVKVTVTGNKNEKLEATTEITSKGTTENEIVFNNIHIDKTITITGTKQLINGTLEDNQFEFTITPDDHNPSHDILENEKTVTNNTAGTIEFLNGTYTNIGEYKYYIKEKVPEIRNSIIYDRTTYELIVKISVDDKGNVTSETTITHDGESTSAIIFKNIYINENVVVPGQKYLVGSDLTEEQFQFSITPENDNPSDDPIKATEVTNAENGNIDFINTTYQHMGTYKYIVKEVIPAEHGNIVYDDTEYEITVDIKEENGGITHNVTITSNNEPVTRIDFTNYYIDTEIHLEGVKYLENGQLENEQFSFEITPNEENPESDVITETTTVKNDADGKIKLFDGEYTEPGIYRYTIKEVIPEDIGNIEYDTTEYEVTITIATEEDEITKTIEIKSNDTIVKTISFTNIVQNIDFKLNGNKILVGNSSIRNFDFIISPDPNNPDGDIINEQTIVNNDSNGLITFLDGQYTKVGTYKYHIQEIIPNDPLNIHYDDTAYDVTVNLSIEDNIINKDITITNSNNETTDNIVFTNIVKRINVTLNGQKKLLGDTLLDQQFRFSITPYETNPISDPIQDVIYVQNNADGEIPLISETYTNEGVYKYAIQEVFNTDKGISFDDTVYEATILVTEDSPGILTSSISIKTIDNDASKDDIVFINATVDLLPNTYDSIPKIIFTLICTISITCVVIYMQNKILKEEQ